MKELSLLEYLLIAFALAALLTTFGAISDHRLAVEPCEDDTIEAILSVEDNFVRVRTVQGNIAEIRLPATFAVGSSTCKR